MTQEPMFYGHPIALSPFVDPKLVLKTDGAILMHGSSRVRGRKSKRPHGRTNGPKRQQYHGYYYAPMWDKIKSKVE